MNNKDRELLIELKTDIKAIKNDVKNLDEKLFGNGAEGLIIAVAKNTTYIKMIGCAVIVSIPVICAIIHFFS